MYIRKCYVVDVERLGVSQCAFKCVSCWMNEWRRLNERVELNEKCW